MNKTNGFSTLYIVIILGSVALSLVLMLSISSFWSIKSATTVKNGFQAKSLVNACGEVALETMREDNNFTGSSSVTLGGNVCDYTITNTGGVNRLIAVSGTVNGVVRKLEIATTAFNPLLVSSWQEVQ